MHRIWTTSAARSRSSPSATSSRSAAEGDELEFWQSLARTPVDQLVPVAELAEDLGFAGLTMSDHLVRPETLASSYPYAAAGQMATDGSTPYLDPWILIAHLARATRRVRFMPAVYIPALRDPFTVAKAVSTAAILSNDRVLLGIGVGWMEEEFALVERDFRRRGRRTDEMLEVVRKLFSGAMVEHHGEFYDFEPVQMAPAPPRCPRILVGGHSPSALARAAAADGWIGVNYELEAVLPILASLRAMRRSLGRAQLPFEAALALNAPP
ncbi:MAG: TIGR03619 family F420-dependent LLM class oxidoreductase, partial [Myxococcales bacterium]